MRSRKSLLRQSDRNQEYVAVLRNGRTLWLKIDPEPVTEQRLENLVRFANSSRKKLSRSIALNLRNTKKLSTLITAGAETFHRKNNRVLKRLAQGDSRLNRRINAYQNQLRKSFDADEEALKKQLSGRTWKSRFDRLVLVSAAPLLSAYGQRTNPFASNNLVITIALGLWLFGDDITNLVTGKKEETTGLDLWSVTAPAANFLTVWWMLRNMQHERFVTGSTDDFSLVPAPVVPQTARLIVLRTTPSNFASGETDGDTDIANLPIEPISPDDGQSLPRVTQDYRAVVDLSEDIASDYLEDFASFSNVPALATIRGVQFSSELGETSEPMVEGVSAWVANAQLVVDLKVSAVIDRTTGDVPQILSTAEVTWAVDTKNPAD